MLNGKRSTSAEGKVEHGWTEQHVDQAYSNRDAHRVLYPPGSTAILSAYPSSNEESGASMKQEDGGKQPEWKDSREFTR